MVRAKFICRSKRFSSFEHDATGNVTGRYFFLEFDPVNKCMNARNPDEEEENSIFGAATPSAELKMLVTESAAQQFEPGEFYYFDATRCDAG